MQNTFKILGKFPAKFIYYEFRFPKQKKYSRNYVYDMELDKVRGYVLDNYNILLTNKTYKKGQTIKLKSYEVIPITTKNIQYYRLTDDEHNKQPFIHYFTGKEKFLNAKILDKQGSNMVYILSSNRKLAKIEES